MTFNQTPESDRAENINVSCFPVLGLTHTLNFLCVTLLIFGVLAMAKLSIWIWIRSLEQAYRNCFLILISSAQFYRI